MARLLDDDKKKRERQRLQRPADDWQNDSGLVAAVVFVSTRPLIGDRITSALAAGNGGGGKGMFWEK